MDWLLSLYDLMVRLKEKQKKAFQRRKQEEINDRISFNDEYD